MLTPLFPAFLFTALLIELTPGPNMAWLALTSAGEGRRAGFAAVAGIALGLGMLGAVSAVGLAELATRSPLVSVCYVMPVLLISCGSHGRRGAG
jgi:threonine/homoserine/homoserine lactone efflux protein